mmetsp:Transcript_147591/g.383773  ORF Transcript_147591/g.383773 Transcript_147591/m.383773 type:complete len:86 (+) Transcript_147591:588-845(+)
MMHCHPDSQGPPCHSMATSFPGHQTMLILTPGSVNGIIERRWLVPSQRQTQAACKRSCEIGHGAVCRLSGQGEHYLDPIAEMLVR